VSAALVTLNAVLLRGSRGASSSPAVQRAARWRAGRLPRLGLWVELPLSRARCGSAPLDLRLRHGVPRQAAAARRRTSGAGCCGLAEARATACTLVRSCRCSASAAHRIGAAAADRDRHRLAAPASAPLAAIAAAGLASACRSPVQPVLAERDLRLRGHARCARPVLLDALLGLLPIRVHGAGPAMLRQPGGAAGRVGARRAAFYAASTVVDGGLALCGAGHGRADGVERGEPADGAGCCCWSTGAEPAGPRPGHRRGRSPVNPVLRNLVLRLLEPLAHRASGSRRRDPAAADAASAGPAARGVAIRMADVTVEAGGHTCSTPSISRGAGRSTSRSSAHRAGKSRPGRPAARLVPPARGSVEVDGRPLAGDGCARCARDPRGRSRGRAWNRSLLDNLRTAASTRASCRWPRSGAARAARGAGAPARRPGDRARESGALVSGGEGQRTRVGARWRRRRARLVVLDEPFRGLDLAARRELLANRGGGGGATRPCCG